MKYCKKCGNQLFDEAVMCPKCGTMQKEEEKASEVKPQQPVQPQQTYQTPVQAENSVWGILALVFGILGSLGLIFGIVGLCLYKTPSDPNHKKNVSFCYVGIGISVFWILMVIILTIAVM